jgi:ribonucleoside-diphosphate reductase alpha chain
MIETKNALTDVPQTIATEKGTALLQQVKKRDGSIADFDIDKIASAALKALIKTSEGNQKQSKEIANNVYIELLRKAAKQDRDYVPEVEQIQDLVEIQLMRMGFEESAKEYILYRSERSKEREVEVQVEIPQEVKDLVKESSEYFHSSYEEFIYYRTYSKWQEKIGRRETWIETVDRTMNFMHENLGSKLSKDEYYTLRSYMLEHKIVPSMRHYWSAGPAARKTNVAVYNCAYTAPTCPKDIAEIMYISMCGTGCGYSVESKYAQQFSIIKKQTGKKLPNLVVADSKEGWADAFAEAMETWMRGHDVEVDYSLIRPKGSPLKTMGGRASGPEPLRRLMEFTRSRVLSRQGKRLSNLDVHDIICMVGECVVAGGVRRSALISLSDLDDKTMRDAKNGQFWSHNPQRSLANNSAVYDSKPDATTFMTEWLGLMESGTGERGIFNRGGLREQLPKRRLEANVNGHDRIDDFGSNPCGEIYLRPKQFCNLTGIVIRPKDTEETLLEKVEQATILGTYQASLTNLGYLSKEWKQNCEEEALLGVSFTGYYDNKVVQQPDVLDKLKAKALEVNKVYAKRFGVNPATAITTVKPSGNSGQMLYSASGMHPRFSEHYIRRVRINATDPLFKLIKDQGGVEYHSEVGQDVNNPTVYVLEFPVKSPKGVKFKDDIGALELLAEWKKIKKHYTEHNPSVTIYVGADEWFEVGNWVYRNWDIVGGLSFLPRSDHVYELAPYEQIDEETYIEKKAKFKGIDFTKLIAYERTDRTTGAKEYACVGDKCEI